MSKIAFLVDQMFEDSEFRVPYDRLRGAGHQIDILGVKAGDTVKGYRQKEQIQIEKSVAQAKVEDYDALVIPGGYSPDHLRIDRGAVAFTRAMGLANKPVAAVCHAPSLLIEADLVYGRQITSWPSVKTDLINAGARWVDREVVPDANIITSRRPDDLPAFSDAILRMLAEGAPARTDTAPGQGRSTSARPPAH
ncbi:MAG TPA: type 1 glutamine amidotransferase domain-containing protein [Kofleriaceae bacterium]|jgi:protease I|nr:type 1 glutamine amidotransferase domain-containing protein [Kofleriaceae bacterium]